MIGTCPKKLAEGVGAFGSPRPFRISEIQDASSFMKLLLPEAERNPQYFKVSEFTFENVARTQKAEGLGRSLLREELLNVTPAPAGSFEEFVYTTRHAPRFLREAYNDCYISYSEFLSRRTDYFAGKPVPITLFDAIKQVIARIFGRESK